MPSDKLQIRNSTAEFLIFASQSGENSIEVRLDEGTIWLSQKLIAELFEVSLSTINEHLSNIYAAKELSPERTIRKFRIVGIEGTRTVAREVEHHNLDAIISVGYRVNSARATQFRQWATQVLRQFATRGIGVARADCERILRPCRGAGTAQNPHDDGRLGSAFG